MISKPNLYTKAKKIFRRPIVHIAVADKFMAPYVEFVNAHFDPNDHLFLLTRLNQNSMPQAENVTDLSDCSRLSMVLKWLWAIARARKVILHGLFDSRLVRILALVPWWLSKCYWVIWGGDLYYHIMDKKDPNYHRNEYFRKFVICRLSGLITHICGDFELARKWYGATGRWYECFMYPSNLYHQPCIRTRPHETTNILVGNSATDTNNHIEALDKLRIYADKNIRIYCPLSYGDFEYAQKISDYGMTLFGDKFIALRDFMSFEKYLDLLAQIDIAIFNHNRQQGMGNITTLLGSGKKVYMRKNVTSWSTFEQLGVQLYDIKLLNLNKLDSDIAKQNHDNISNYFSKSILVKQIMEVIK
ncbi:TDP-N-acetylfucosamine:lipid II N-acetylfucosaminyltransferase [Methylomonas rapida]|uniref:TDP-N-acetylfucosamine:lipid II N-acetylfucosaminyltransferase n=1 Tax=Methylomonas rapida TaxID=2963939 RepID=A0ABY7GFN3_9GAMM|nr:TDP-N-acetylfucosamine:lipid II N-acetylfucosaminyltransferase [Methylomonas rapida]WAR44077.1 TDP-N-acetylfucosamine:lipid II N-acetylfucosaminyltransferase [Methylomonas rapida]